MPCFTVAYVLTGKVLSLLFFNRVFTVLQNILNCFYISRPSRFMSSLARFAELDTRIRYAVMISSYRHLKQRFSNVMSSFAVSFRTNDSFIHQLFLKQTKN